MMRRDGAFACGASRASSRHLMAIVRRSNTLAQPGAGAGGGDWSGRAPRRWRLSGTRFPSLGLLKRLSTLVAAIDGAAAHESTGSRKGDALLHRCQRLDLSKYSRTSHIGAYAVMSVANTLSS